MLVLTPQQRRELRAKAHHLHPVVSIGQHGLTPQVLHEVDVALKAHELVKVRVFDDDRAAREAMLARIAEALDAAPVQHLGKLVILWRPAPPKDAAPAKIAKRPSRKPVPRIGSAARERKPPAPSASPDRRRSEAAAGKRRTSTRSFQAAAARPAGDGTRRRRRGSER